MSPDSFAWSDVDFGAASSGYWTVGRLIAPRCGNCAGQKHASLVGGFRFARS
jgi:hypothetical protein